MKQNGKRLFLGKIVLEGKIITKTGLHIGGSTESMQIGGVDLPIIKDSGNNLPYIPGSSLKGKLRSTLEKFGKRTRNEKEEKLSFNRNIGTRRNTVFIHCCEDIKYALKCDVCRVFGSSGDDKALPKGQKADNFPSLLIVRDCLLDESLMHAERPLTEEKTETGLDRVTMAANPRTVERVVPGTVFRFGMVYSVESIELNGGPRSAFSTDILEKDLKNLLTCMQILENEGIGGYASRGYGKVTFKLTDFGGRSLGYYEGDLEKEIGRFSDEGFSLDKARKEIDTIVEFFEKESGRVLTG